MNRFRKMLIVWLINWLTIDWWIDWCIEDWLIDWLIDILQTDTRDNVEKEWTTDNSRAWFHWYSFGFLRKKSLFGKGKPDASPRSIHMWGRKFSVHWPAVDLYYKTTCRWWVSCYLESSLMKGYSSLKNIWFFFSVVLFYYRGFVYFIVYWAWRKRTFGPSQ